MIYICMNINMNIEKLLMCFCCIVDFFDKIRWFVLHIFNFPSVLCADDVIFEFSSFENNNVSDLKRIPLFLRDLPPGGRNG